MKCSICGEEIQPDKLGWNKGNNAQPINNGRCCDICNTYLVIPMRCQVGYSHEEYSKLMEEGN